MESRAIVEWSTDVYEAVVDLAKRVCEYIEANEPDTLAFEWFGDEETGKVIWYQVYSNDEAFLKHAQNMKDSGLADEASGLMTQTRLVLLTPPTHPHTIEMAGQAGAEQLRPIEGIVR